MDGVAHVEPFLEDVFQVLLLKLLMQKLLHLKFDLSILDSLAKVIEDADNQYPLLFARFLNIVILNVPFFEHTNGQE